MPNKYSQPVQSQFVPTFTPFDPQVAQNIATGLQQRQQRGMESYDRLQEMFSQIESRALQQDKPLLQAQLENVRGDLDQIVADGDFTDVQPKIRKSATQLKENLRKGPLSKVVRNYENAQKSIENIRDTELSDSEKDNLINTILSEYEGVLQGDVFSEFTPAEYVNPEEKARELIDGIPKEKIKKDTGWSEQRYNDWVKRGKTFEGLPQSVIENYVKPSLQSDQKVMDYLRQKAYVQTAGLPPEERKQKINELTDEYLNQASELAWRGEGTRGMEMTDPFTGEQVTLWGSGANEIEYSQFAPTKAKGDSSYSILDINGITKAADRGFDSLTGALRDLSSYKNRGETQNASLLQSSINNALDQFMKDNNFTKEQIDLAKGVITSNISSQIIEDLLITSGEAGGRAVDQRNLEIIKSQMQEEGKQFSTEDLKVAQNVVDQFSEWIEKEGGWTDRIITPDTTQNEGEQVYNNINTTLTKGIGSNPNLWNVSGMGDSESNEYLKENMQNLRFLGVVPPNKYSPTTIRMIDEDGNIVDIVEKKGPMKRRDITDGILQKLGEPGLRVLENRRLEEVPINNVQENHYDKLPPQYQASVPGNYLSFVSDEGGKINLTYGKEDDQKKFTTGDYFYIQLNNHRNGPVTPAERQELQRKIMDLNKNSSDPLTEEEIQRMDDDPSSVMEALKEAFEDPYGFPDRASAINHLMNLNK